MAGGITGCPNWQQEVIASKQDDPRWEGIVLLNPRRDTFNLSDPSESEFQIAWEFYHIRSADFVFFWFPKEGKCMITLYELGEAIGCGRSIQVGCHPEYERAFDVRQQLHLARPDIVIYDSLEKLYNI